MKMYRKSMVVAGLIMLAGCSLDGANRLGYGIVQNIGQQQCQKAMADDCETKRNYDTYQRERREVSP